MHARISQSDVVRWLVLLGLVGCLIVVTQPICAQESAKFEKIREMSPDKKFGVRISCSSEPEDPDKIDPDLITGVELVSLPSKEVVMKLPQNYDGGVPNVIWSQDSKWLAFSLSSGPRVTDTYVYHRSGDDFVAMGGEEELAADVKGDVRNQYVSPIRWVKPRALLLEQYVIFRGGKEGTYQSHYQFTAKFDEKTGKFQIISKKKVPSKE
jgi:hypothetical protein